VFIRRDQDESADVDVMSDEETKDSMEMELISSSAPTPDPPPIRILDLPSVPGRPPRYQERSRKASEPVTQTKPSEEAKHKPPIKDINLSKSKRTRGPKSDTYKVAWSVDEQHLLEQLMEEIPDGVKNRWAKISQAMNGRRTARQVASRVQKYHEKLRKFGVDIDETKADSE